MSIVAEENREYDKSNKIMHGNMILIRKGHIKDLKELLHEDWAWGGNHELQNKYITALQEESREFLAVEDKDKIVGELWIFWDNEDKTEANGKERAYVSTLRLHPDYQRQGIGTKMIKKAFELIKESGYKEVTIGAYTHEPEIQELYKKWGFTKRIKESSEMSSGKDLKYILFLKKL